MRIGVSGKGGIGKTTISAVLARTLARRGHRVIAIDCDSDPNLGTGIGLGEEGAAELRPFLDQSGPERTGPMGLTPTQILARYGHPGPDGVTVMLGARVEKVGSGCTGAAHITIRDFIENIEDELPGAVVVADMEAGIEHLSWAGGTLRHVDVLLVVLEPTAKVLITATRTLALALELGIRRVAFVGNRCDLGDEQRLSDFAAAAGVPLLAVIPVDDAVRQTDVRSTCLLDHAPDSPSVAAITILARRLEADYMGVPAN